MSDVLSVSARGACTPSSTYRLQFHADFPFSQARALAPYFQSLGISHVYSSPILQARAGSGHGYDIVDYGEVNPELGGEAEFRALASTLRESGIGIILDIVPNHMAVGAADNALWLDVLKHGRKSRYAKWFDIDFESRDPELHGRVHAPFLGAPYWEELAAERLLLQAMPDGGFAIVYGEHQFPIRPEDEAEIGKIDIETYRNKQKLDALITRQNFVLDWWRNAGDRINWRRFFDVTQLAAMRMEEPEAFEAAHAVTFRLYREGLIDGVRIDHVDGLTDPERYCKAVRARLSELEPERPASAAAGPAWIVVEKILAADERLPTTWSVAGTTGYDFMDQVSALQHAAASKSLLESHWASISGRAPAFEVEEDTARLQILAHSFDGARARLTASLSELAARQALPITAAAMGRAVTQILTQMRVYRIYAGADSAALEAALAAVRRDPLSDRAPVDFVASLLLGPDAGADSETRADIVRLFNQISAPLAAKAVEDTAFYRYGRLLSRNDVGFDAATLAIEPERFHTLMRGRAEKWPHAMLTTATHDHKRGEDLRARLAVVSERPEAWIQSCNEWSSLNEAIRPAVIDAGEEYHFYQMLAGAWPLDLPADDTQGLRVFRDRLTGWRVKSLREAKLHTSWTSPDETYEKAWSEFLTKALDSGVSSPFLASLHSFVQTIAAAGAANSLVQMALRCTAPGIPDQYQGTEFWDFSFVDPDNRRVVDYEARKIALSRDASLDSLAEIWRGGEVKQSLLRLLLCLRRDHPAPFHGDYEALEATGSRKSHVVAFLRRKGHEAILLVAGIHMAEGCSNGRIAPKAGWWGDTLIALPHKLSTLEPIVGPAVDMQEGILVADALEHLPVSVWRLTIAPH